MYRYAQNHKQRVLYAPLRKWMGIKNDVRPLPLIGRLNMRAMGYSKNCTWHPEVNMVLGLGSIRSSVVVYGAGFMLRPGSI